MEILIKKLKILEKAIDSLESAFKKYTWDDLQRDGILQRFEYTTELLRKTTKKILEYSDINIDIPSPKNIIKIAHEYHIIKNQRILIDFIDFRNRLSHIYDEDQAQEIFLWIQEHYKEIRSTYTDLLKCLEKLWNSI